MRAGRVAIGPVIAGAAALGAFGAFASCEALFPTHLDDAVGTDATADGSVATDAPVVDVDARPDGSPADAAADRRATDAALVMDAADAAEAGPNPCLAATDDPASVLANVVAGFRATEGTMCPWEYGYFQDLADGGESAFTRFPTFSTASNEWVLPGTYAAAGSGTLVPDVNLRPDFRWISTYTGTVDIEASVSLLQFPASEQALGITVYVLVDGVELAPTVIPNSLMAPLPITKTNVDIAAGQPIDFTIDCGGDSNYDDTGVTIRILRSIVGDP
jgi:hypothetical protein